MGGRGRRRCERFKKTLTTGRLKWAGHTKLLGEEHLVKSSQWRRRRSRLIWEDSIKTDWEVLGEEGRTRTKERGLEGERRKEQTGHGDDSETIMI